MHTTTLRGPDFELTQDGEVVPYDSYFASFAVHDRLGLIVHDPLDGLGAASLVLAYVTAFYDQRRKQPDDFVAYPDFFTFQPPEDLTSYGMLDIWPEYKDVPLPDGVWPRIATIASRAISILVVPESNCDASLVPGERRHHVILDSLRSSVRQCYAYAPTGSVSRPDVTIQCTAVSSTDWGLAVIESAHRESDCVKRRHRWEDAYADGSLTQSFKQIDLETALGAVAPDAARS